MVYGKELIMDLYGCNPEKFNRKDLAQFFEELCGVVDMVACERFFWDDLDVPEEERQTELHTKGTSAIQFILTSNITTHTLDLVGEVYINLFSCKDFNEGAAKFFAVKWFDAKYTDSQIIIRGEGSKCQNL